MDVGAAFIPNAEAAELMQPRQGSFYDPSVHAESAAMIGSTARQYGLHAQLYERIAMRIGMIGSISLNTIGAPTGPSALTGDGRNRTNQRQKLGYVVPVRAGKNGGERNTIRIGDDMVLRAVFPAIRGVRAGLRPPKTARTEALSTTARDQSILSASRSRLSSTWCMSCQTPASCHSWSRRQQVMPQPQPISCGRSSHGMPVLSTNRMPVSVLRCSIGVRPPLGRGLCGGKQGSMSSQSSSVSSGFAIGPSSMTTKNLKSLLIHRVTNSLKKTFC